MNYIEESEQVLFSEKEKVFTQKTGKSFTVIYQKYYPKLIYFTSKICTNHQKAEDIATESFMIALDKIDKYEKDKSQFSTWLFTIAKNLSLQELKIGKKSISIDVEYDEEGTTMKDFINDESVEDSEYIRSVYDKKSDVIKEHMVQLKEPYKTVIEMREMKKMAYKDIADELGKPLSTIKSQIRNGRHILISKSKKQFEQIDNLYM